MWGQHLSHHFRCQDDEISTGDLSALLLGVITCIRSLRDHV
jgi:hypothetical protein